MEGFGKGLPINSLTGMEEKISLLVSGWEGSEGSGLCPVSGELWMEFSAKRCLSNLFIKISYLLNIWLLFSFSRKVGRKTKKII